MALTRFGLPFLLPILMAVHGLRNQMPMDQYLISHGYGQARLDVMSFSGIEWGFGRRPSYGVANRRSN